MSAAPMRADSCSPLGHLESFPCSLTRDRRSRRQTTIPTFGLKRSKVRGRLREFDIATKAFVPGGFHLPEAKGGAEWLDKDTLLLSSALGDGMATASGYARTVRLWQRGVDVAKASMLFETTPDSMSAWASVDRTQGTERIWFVERPAF